MPKVPVIIKAKYSTKCPECNFSVIPGTTCKVYANEWYHMDCWSNRWEKVLTERYEENLFNNNEEEKKLSASENEQGQFIGLANSIEVSSSKFKGDKVGAKKKFKDQVKIQVHLEKDDKDFIYEFGKSTYRSISDVIRLAVNNLRKEYNKEGAKHGI